MPDRFKQFTPDERALIALGLKRVNIPEGSSYAPIREKLVEEVLK